jgi:hypothetical protein
MFHVPCVRAYYTKQNNIGNVFMVPSCITAMMSGINIDMRIFHSLTSPYEIIAKYNSRGFRIMLNRNNTIKLWKFQNSLPNTHKFYTNLLLTDFFQSVLCSNKTLLENIYKQSINSDINFLNICAINIDGTVRPLQQWLLSAVNEILIESSI